MLDRIFPKSLDSKYYGQSLAIYLFYAITVIKVVVAMVAYDQSIISSGLAPAHAEVLIGILFMLIAMRYRSTIPILYLMMLIYYSLVLTSSINNNWTEESMYISKSSLFAYILLIIGFVLSTTGERCYYRNNAVLKRP